MYYWDDNGEQKQEQLTVIGVHYVLENVIAPYRVCSSSSVP